MNKLKVGDRVRNIRVKIYKDEPIEVETRIKVIAGCVLPEPELLAPTPPIEQALASIEENIIKDE